MKLNLAFILILVINVSEIFQVMWLSKNNMYIS